MVAINFSAEHAGKVEAREKTQTIRRKSRCAPGDKIQLYTGQRTKQCRKLVDDDPTCLDVTYVAIRPGDLTLGNTSRFPRDIDDFARLDGFADYEQMHRWFAERYKTEFFIGQVIRWHWPETGR